MEETLEKIKGVDFEWRKEKGADFAR